MSKKFKKWKSQKTIITISSFFPPQIYGGKLLKPDKYKQVVIDSLAFLVKNNPIKVYGFVVMHLIWKINQQHKRESVQRDFLTYTAQQIMFDLSLHHPKVLAHFEVNLKDRKYQFWERNPLSIDLFSRTVIEQKLDYIHANPLQEKWSLVQKPEDYWYSSFRFYEFGIDVFDFLSHYMEDC